MFAALSTRLDGEMQRIVQQLTTKVIALAERYAETLPQIESCACGPGGEGCRTFETDGICGCPHGFVTKYKRWKIPQGYKWTELGVIPEEWEVYTIRDCINLLTDFDANGSFADVALNVNTYDPVVVMRGM